MAVEEIDLTLSDDEHPTRSQGSFGIIPAVKCTSAASSRIQLRFGSARVDDGLGKNGLWDFEAMETAGGLLHLMVDPRKPPASYFLTPPLLDRPRRSVISLKGWSKDARQLAKEGPVSAAVQPGALEALLAAPSRLPVPQAPNPIAELRLPPSLPQRPRFSPEPKSRLPPRSPSPPRDIHQQYARRRSPSPVFRSPRWAPSNADADRGDRWATQQPLDASSRLPLALRKKDEQPRRGAEHSNGDRLDRWRPRSPPPRDGRRSRSRSFGRPPFDSRRRRSPSTPPRRRSRSPPPRTRPLPGRSPTLPAPSRLPPLRLSVADRAHHCRALGVRDYQPLLLPRRVNINWRYEYHQAQLDLILACQPETILWSKLPPNTGIFDRSQGMSSVKRTVLWSEPDRSRLGALGEKGAEVMIDGDWPRWRALMVAGGWLYGLEESLSWKQLRWVMEDSRLEILGLVTMMAELSRYRDGVDRSFEELHYYLAGIHSIKLNFRLHRALSLVDWLCDCPERLRKERFFVDENGKIRDKAVWTRYLDGEDEDLVDRLQQEENERLGIPSQVEE